MMEADLDQEQRWDLSRLYASPEDPQIDDDLVAASADAEALNARYAGKLATLSPEEIRTVIDAVDDLSGRLNRLFYYAYLLFSCHTQDDASKTLYARMQRDVPEIQNEFAFVMLELQKLPDERFAELLAAPALAEYWDHLGRIRRVASYALDAVVEKVIALKDSTGIQGWTQLYFETTADFRVRLERPDQEAELTLSKAYSLRESGDRDLRRVAFDETLKAHADSSRVLTSVFNALFENYRHMMELRGYEHPFSPLIVEENLAPEVIETLMETVESSYGLVHRYFRAKAAVLGIEDFAGHDVRCQYPNGSSYVSFEEGRAIVLDAIASFSPQQSEIARAFFDEGYIDAVSRPGKRAGAYCASSGPTFHPYIFLNYAYTLKEVITMAHELGHGIHNVIGGEHQTLTNCDRVTMFMETPSTFCETLTFNRLLALEVNHETRRTLLGGQIEAAILKIFKSIAVTRFQLNAYERRKTGIISATEYCALWEEQLYAMYGDAVAFGEWDKWEWLTFNHTLNLPFYDYAYTFGQLLVYALMRRYQEEGPAFEPRYVELLKSGTSITIGPLLAKVGVELNDPNFWRQGLTYLEELLEEFEAMAYDQVAESASSLG